MKDQKNNQLEPQKGKRDLPKLQSKLTDWPLSYRPGFLIRRVHQIHVALFSKICANFEITPIQYSLLATLATKESADQSSLAMEIGMDKTTTAGAIKRLEARDLLHRFMSVEDKRSQICVITEKGLAFLEEIEPLAKEAHKETIDALSEPEQYLLLQLLQKIVEKNG